MKNDEKKHNILGVFIGNVICAVMSTLLVLLFMLLFSILISKEILSADMLEFLGIFGIFIASLLTGFVLSRSRGRALLTSIVQGVCNFFLYYLMGLLVFMRIIPGNINWYYFIACMAGAVIGGVLSAVFTPQRRRIKTK